MPPTLQHKSYKKKEAREDTSIRDENIQVSGGRLLEDIIIAIQKFGLTYLKVFLKV